MSLTSSPNSTRAQQQALAGQQQQQRDRQPRAKPIDAPDQLIIALDLPSAREALTLVDRLDARCRWFKVGMELFYAAGADLVRELRRRQLNVFLDLKLHDIPNTVAAAIGRLSELDVQLLTVHAGGGPEMLTAAQRAAQDSGRVALLGVTVLTSIDNAQLREIGVTDDPATQVLRLARLAHQAGLAGVVCSPLEVTSVRAALGPDALLVIPGIRPAATAADDQKRIATPRDAIRNGASMLVVGRPITRASDPAQAAAEILAQMQ